MKSKTLAERAAWDFIKNEGRGMELSTVNPVGVFGPVMGKVRSQPRTQTQAPNPPPLTLNPQPLTLNP